MRTILSIFLCFFVLISSTIAASKSGGWVLFQGKVGTGESGVANLDNWDIITAFFVGSSLTSGATINLEGRNQLDEWVVLHTQVLNSSTNAQIVQFLGPFQDLRANVTSYTDGSYNVTLFGLQNR